jgi:Sec-independent protein secretion pathway component TatC
MKRPVKRAIKEGTMKHVFDVVSAFVIAAAVLFGMGLLLQVGSSALELVALR